MKGFPPAGHMIKMYVVITILHFICRDRNMLSGSRYQETDFKQAIQMLKLIRMQPTYLIFKNFEREFVNKKAFVSILAVLFGRLGRLDNYRKHIGSLPFLLRPQVFVLFFIVLGARVCRPGVRGFVFEVVWKV